MQVIELEMVTAYRNGFAAAQAGQGVSANPFSAVASDARSRVQALMWVRGFGDGNPVDPEADISLE